VVGVWWGGGGGDRPVGREGDQAGLAAGAVARCFPRPRADLPPRPRATLATARHRCAGRRDLHTRAGRSAVAPLGPPPYPLVPGWTPAPATSWSGPPRGAIPDQGRGTSRPPGAAAAGAVSDRPTHCPRGLAPHPTRQERWRIARQVFYGHAWRAMVSPRRGGDGGGPDHRAVHRGRGPHRRREDGSRPTARHGVRSAAPPRAGRGES